MLEPSDEQDAIYLFRSDVNEPLSTYSRHGFTLEGRDWPSVEHYFQAMKFADPVYQEVIRSAGHPRKARRLGRTRMKRIRRDWRTIRRVIMTRGIYTKCRTHPEVAERLLATGNRRLVESSAYDYFWGCGRDRRGSNYYGRVLMDVRAKLREEGGQVVGCG